MGKSHKKKNKHRKRNRKIKLKCNREIRRRLLEETISEFRVDPESSNHSPEKNNDILAAEQRKQRGEYLRDVQKGNRLKLQIENRNIDDLIDEATQKVGDFKMSHDHKPENGSLNLKCTFIQVINAADIILEILDARDPLGSRCPQVEEYALNTRKILILVLNKIDLIPKNNLFDWLRYLRQEVPTIAFKSSIECQNVYLSQLEDIMVHMNGSLLSSRCCVGASFLFNLLENYSRNQNIQTLIKVGVVGFPNVGKRSVINSLKQFYSFSDGKTTDLTNTVKNVEILDNPGAVYAKGDSSVTLALRNTVNVEDLKDVAASAEAIVQKVDPKLLCLHYSIPQFSSSHDLLCSLATKMGKFKKSGDPDFISAAIILIHDWNNGNIKYYTNPPEKFIHSQYISTEYIVQMSQVFDIPYEKELAEINKAPLLFPIVSIPTLCSEPTECSYEKEMEANNCTSPKVITEFNISEENTAEKEDPSDKLTDRELLDLRLKHKVMKHKKKRFDILAFALSETMKRSLILK